MTWSDGGRAEGQVQVPQCQLALSSVFWNILFTLNHYSNSYEFLFKFS